MKDLLDRIEAYDLLNFLLPGILFSFLSGWITSYSLLQQDLVFGVFVYYFIGLVISRFGSLVVEPFLKWVGLVTFSDYEDFIKASKKDDKIVVLSRANNMYRTLLSMIVLLILLRCYELVKSSLMLGPTWDICILGLGLLVLFLFSYVKQTRYIRERVAVRR